ncbi:MAG: hypothetical protein F6K00_01505 [Leptolyngbya sp. SIOISBB]|nr:hypothetical protein [Leptolyngbya sp. SIOISBB]
MTDCQAFAAKKQAFSAGSHSLRQRSLKQQKSLPSECLLILLAIGIELAVVTIWMIEYETKVTKLITLYPDKETR